MTNHAKSIILILIDNSYFEGLDITGTSVYDLIMNRFYWYLTNIEDKMIVEASYYTRLLVDEVSTYFKNFFKIK